jgi:hypothetical protein
MAVPVEVDLALPDSLIGLVHNHLALGMDNQMDSSIIPMDTPTALLRMLSRVDKLCPMPFPEDQQVNHAIHTANRVRRPDLAHVPKHLLGAHNYKIALDERHRCRKRIREYQ